MIMKYKQKIPQIHESCYVSETAVVIGDVTLQRDVSVWFNTVIRADKDHIDIGEGSNIQDNCTLHTDPSHQLRIGKHVTVGHNVVLHGVTIEDECLIGMGAILLNGAKVGKHCIIGAGALVVENQKIPDNSVAIGCPAKVIKNIQASQIQEILENAQHYIALGKEYKERYDGNHEL